ncbi:hypothetical protein CLV70_1469 [Pseudosporangium ferrugineum]|uniref:Uncharacterized protein n=1 Tax=Pseudosporangium ferrugineum TaxID=439699 RepID=A0A2T0RC12_9ACTN|nr:hypothetical protein CLV70_1469 [Pseudosporangium ferrugineum]
MYVAVFYDRRGAELHQMPFENADNAMAYVRENPRIRLKQSVGNALLRGAFSDNVKTWRSATVWHVSGEGSRKEYFSFQQ